MTTFVLVHGAFHGGWCWQRLSDILVKRGHRVFAPTLTGLCERSHLLDERVNLSTHIEDVANLIRFEDLSGVVLVGHSYAGFVISGVAERVPGRIASIVYLDAFVPENGKAMADYWPPGLKKEWDDAVAEAGGLVRKPLPAAFFKLPAADTAWVDAKCTPHPYATMNEKLTLTGACERIPKKTYILAENFPSKNFRMFYERAKADPGWRTYGLPSGHEVMIELPESLAKILEEVA
jgi:pimeloyl-ACP methyl ester carboxylesterase